MRIGDLVKLKKKTIMAYEDVKYGLIYNVWLINGEQWFRVLWDNGNSSSIVSYDIETAYE